MRIKQEEEGVFAPPLIEEVRGAGGEINIRERADVDHIFESELFKREFPSPAAPFEEQRRQMFESPQIQDMELEIPPQMDDLMEDYQDIDGFKHFFDETVPEIEERMKDESGALLNVRKIKKNLKQMQQ